MIRHEARLLTLGLLIAAACATGDGPAPQRATPMIPNDLPSDEPTRKDQPALRAAFETALESRGAAYAQARSELLEEIDHAEPMLESEAQSGDAKRALLARAIRGYHRDAATFAKARALLHGEGLPPARNILGKHSAETLGREIAKLGEVIDPWLFEQIWHRPEAHGEDQRSVLYSAAEQRNSPALLGPMTERARDAGQDEDERSSALRVAVRTGDDETRLAIKDLLDDEAQPDGMRRAAAWHLTAAKPHPPGLRKSLEAVLESPDSDIGLKQMAASGLGTLDDRAALPALHQAAGKASDESLIVALCSALQQIGDASSLPVIRAACARVTDDVNTRLCEEYIHDLESQLREGN
jgi:hypothetical protein